MEETRISLQQENNVLAARKTNKSKRDSKGIITKAKLEIVSNVAKKDIGRKIVGAKTEKEENKENKKPEEKIVLIGATLNAAQYDPETDEWYLDSGASQHMSGRKEWFKNYISLQNL